MHANCPGLTLGYLGDVAQLWKDREAVVCVVYPTRGSSRWFDVMVDVFYVILIVQGTATANARADSTMIYTLLHPTTHSLFTHSLQRHTLTQTHVQNFPKQNQNHPRKQTPPQILTHTPHPLTQINLQPLPPLYTHAKLMRVVMLHLVLLRYDSCQQVQTL